MIEVALLDIDNDERSPGSFSEFRGSLDRAMGTVRVVGRRQNSL
jgi:hypothetical protein